MMQYWRAVVVCFAAVLMIGSCAGGNKLAKKRIECTERMEKAVELYKRGKFSTVVYRLEDVRISCNGSPIMDTVLYYLGMANMNDKQYVEAQTEFQRLIHDFPGSPFFDEAKFRIGYTKFRQGHSSNRDQKETREAIRLLDNYIESYPHSAFIDSATFYRQEAYEKLAKKEFDNAAFYVKANEPEAAVVYYKTFLRQFMNSRLVDQARFNLIGLLIKLNRASEAVDLYTLLVREGKDKKLIKAAGEMTARFRKKPAQKEK